MFIEGEAVIFLLSRKEKGRRDGDMFVEGLDQE